MQTVLFFLFFGGAELLLMVAVSRAPRASARFVLLPVGKPTVLPIPPRVAALVLRPQDGTATYRAAPERKFALAALPGEPSVTREEQVLDVVPDSNWVLARPRRWTTNLVRVEASFVADQLVLKARRLPGEVVWVIIAFVALARTHGSVLRHPLTVFIVLFPLFLVRAQQRLARDGFAAVVEEMRRRVAIANGEPPKSPEPGPPLKMIGDQWVCACGMANKMRKTTCGRCWAQRPGAT